MCVEPALIFGKKKLRCNLELGYLFFFSDLNLYYLYPT